MCRPAWGELLSSQYEVFPSVTVKCLFQVSSNPLYQCLLVFRGQVIFCYSHYIHLMLFDGTVNGTAFFKIYLRETETEHERGRGRERERETQNPKQDPGSGCQHRAQRGAQTHKPRDHDVSQSWMLNRLSHPGAPGIGPFFKVSSRPMWGWNSTPRPRVTCSTN